MHKEALLPQLMKQFRHRHFRWVCIWRAMEEFVEASPSPARPAGPVSAITPIKAPPGLDYIVRDWRLSYWGAPISPMSCRRDEDLGRGGGWRLPRKWQIAEGCFRRLLPAAPIALVKGGAAHKMLAEDEHSIQGCFRPGNDIGLAESWICPKSAPGWRHACANTVSAQVAAWKRPWASPLRPASGYPRGTRTEAG